MNDCTRRRPVREALLVRLSDLIGRLGSWLHHEGDLAARGEGLQVEMRHAGLTRCYRDPRFDSLATCGTCRGSGADGPARYCTRCRGTGRVRLQATAIGDRP